MLRSSWIWMKRGWTGVVSSVSSLELRDSRYIGSSSRTANVQCYVLRSSRGRPPGARAALDGGTSGRPGGIKGKTVLNVRAMTTTSTPSTMPWETRYDELVQYKAKHGDCNVPWDHQGKLGVW
ncbi:hypothetical protein THAOC_07311, partial [Thalassiosira oceanica]